MVDGYSEAMGGYNERVKQHRDIVPAIQRAQRVVASGQTALLEIITKEESDFPYRGAVVLLPQEVKDTGKT
jgi:hypothetical protein